MKLEKIEAGSCDASPKENCVPNSAVYSKIQPCRQGRTVPPMPPVESGISVDAYCASLVPDYFDECHWVKGELGRIQVLGSPIVFVGLHSDCTIVWICATRLPRGWSDPRKTFLLRKAGGSRRGAFNYAIQLAEYVRKAAEKEAGYRDRQKAGYLAEKFGGAE